jgi:hypothetical protein
MPAVCQGLCWVAAGNVAFPDQTFYWRVRPERK